MNAGRNQSMAVHAIVVILSLLTGYLFDLAVQSLQYKAGQTFHFGPSLVASFLIPVLLAALFLSLAWYLFSHLPSSLPAAYFFLVAGLIGMLATVSMFLPKPLFLKRLVFLYEFWTLATRVGSSFYMISSSLLVLGIAGVFRRRHA